jgi:hypothetical protein
MKSIRVRSATADRRLRIFAIPILIATVVEGILGSALFSESLTVWNALPHIILALVMVEMTAHAFVISLRLRGLRHKVAAALAMVSTLGATISGAIFLFAGESPAALESMEVTTGLLVVGTLLLLLWGSVPLTFG